MSETKHYIGKLKPTGKSVAEYLHLTSIPKQYENEEEYFSDMCYQEAVLIDGQVYQVDKIEVEEHEDIFRSNVNNDGTIEFEIRYYSGGCSFEEAIEYAIKERKKPCL